VPFSTAYFEVLLPVLKLLRLLNACKTTGKTTGKARLFCTNVIMPGRAATAAAVSSVPNPRSIVAPGKFIGALVDV
jgi:hypothetical protein